MVRLLRNGAAGLLVGLLLALAVVWVRSYRVVDSCVLIRVRRLPGAIVEREWRVRASGGGLDVRYDRRASRDPQFIEQYIDPPRFTHQAFPAQGPAPFPDIDLARRGPEGAKSFQVGRVKAWWRSLSPEHALLPGERVAQMVLIVPIWLLVLIDVLALWLVLAGRRLAPAVVGGARNGGRT